MLTLAIVITALLGYGLGFIGSRRFWKHRTIRRILADVARQEREEQQAAAAE
jgi:hypothetical protein